MELIDAALRTPSSGTRARPAMSVRRTTHVDMLTAPRQPLVLRGARRDLFTSPDGQAHTLSASSVDATVGSDRTIRALVTDPPEPLVEALVGSPVGKGFRARLDEVFGPVAQSLELYSLLEELPVAAVLSGYAEMYRLDQSPATSIRGVLPADVCAGWRRDGFMMTVIDQTGEIPLPVGPPTLPLAGDDGAAWHAMAELGRGGMRRRRLVEVTDGDPYRVWAMFQDTHVGEDGVTRVLHEYEVEAEVTRDLVMADCRAMPRVLPWSECPVAAQSATRLVGHPVTEVRARLREEFHGTSVCTHLNDLLRSLGDVATLSVRLEAARATG